MAHGYRAVGWSPFKRRYDAALGAVLVVYLGVFAGATLALRPEITLETLLLRAFGTAAFALLHVVLAIGPLSRLDRRFLPLLHNRRHLGVTMFLCALAHGALATFQFHALGDANPLASVLASKAGAGLAGSPFQPLGLAALVVLFLMAATSHDFWLAQLTAPVWKALHMGVYAAYALVVAHVALGVLQDERAPSLALPVLAGTVVLGGLHLAAARREQRIDAARARAAADGYVEACGVDEIAEKSGRVAFLAGERVAIFRYDGRIAVLSNVCQHQNGPLGEGRIVDGCVTCPWHGYQYLPESGASPPPFTERVPTFRARVVDGRVFVDPRPLPPGTPVEPAVFAERHAPPSGEFFVGYLATPPLLRRFLPRAVAALGLGGVALAALLAAGQGPLGTGEFDYGVVKTIEGTLASAPVPALWVPRPGVAADGVAPATVVPLVGVGKHGVGADVLAKAGRRVRLEGSWIRRGGLAAFEVAGAAAAPVEIPGAVSAALPVGPARLVGEIVDSKCWLGVMKPGEGKSHRDCAIRCISGGAPAAIVARDGAGSAAVLLLVGADGTPLGRELLDVVGEPVEAVGEVLRLGDVVLFATSREAVRRYGEAR
jgi:nitrite reductase/ring-hydroxylating ferredoxin subunit/DMSO/TMAO reductase YedYZ heme-binding membrane subunit